MDCLLLQPHQPLLPPNFMNPFSLSCKLTLTHSLKPKTLFSSFRFFCASSKSPTEAVIQSPNGNGKPSSTISRARIELLKENWLTSLSSPPPSLGIDDSMSNGGIRGPEWVIGVDPDVSGALALLKFERSGCVSAQVFDSPFVQTSVGKRLRKRLDARSIVQLVQSFQAPSGTIAYVEQSIPFPRDGKQGWWSGGFGYGLWIGVLVASGFSVVPVPSSVWKRGFELASSRSSKDDSREFAAQLFPTLSTMLKRKKDHGRAEALLIAAYGKGHLLKPDVSCTPDMVDKLSLETAPSESCTADMVDALSLKTAPRESRTYGKRHKLKPDVSCTPDIVDEISLETARGESCTPDMVDELSLENAPGESCTPDMVDELSFETAARIHKE